MEERGTSGTINLSIIKDQNNLTGQVHHLPCCIKFNGAASVSHYFKPRSAGFESDGLEVEEAYFRGRKLHGALVSLPNGYSGFVLGKKNSGKRKAAEDGSICWETKARFDKLTYWNHETVPTKNDAMLRTFHWFSVAKALHKPVKPEVLVSTSDIIQKS